jgi:hypothetical protein
VTGEWVKLPDAEDAQIEPAKLRDYLLSSTHPIGRFKYRFFSRLGYTSGQWRRLEADLRELAVTGEATPGESTEYGQKYEVRGMLKGPSGRMAEVVTVWIVLAGQETPRFVTAFPGGA